MRLCRDRQDRLTPTAGDGMAFSSASRTAMDLFMWHGDVVLHGTVDWTFFPGRGARGVDRVAWNFFEGRNRR